MPQPLGNQPANRLRCCMRNGPSLGYSCVENGSHPVSAALDFLDEGSGSFCGDTYYLRYLDMFILSPTDIGVMGTVDQVSVRSIFKHLPWAFVMMSSKRSPIPGCLCTKALLLRT